MLLFPQAPELKSLYDEIFNELSHLVGNQQSKLGQPFIFVYYLYLVYCHRIIRGAPPRELARLRDIVIKYETDIVRNYAESKRSNVSRVEELVTGLVTKYREELDIKSILSPTEGKVLTCATSPFRFLLMPSSRVRMMVEKNQSFKQFGIENVLVPYSLDLLADNLDFEINGPYHYYEAVGLGLRLNGHTKLKKEFVEAVGLTYVEVPYWEVSKLAEQSPTEQVASLQSLIARAKAGGVKA